MLETTKRQSDQSAEVYMRSEAFSKQDNSTNDLDDVIMLMQTNDA